MGKAKFTDEQKGEAVRRAEHYIRNGWGLRQVFRQLEADYQAEGKEMISWWTFYPLAAQLRLELQLGSLGEAADSNGGNGGNGDAESEEPSEADEAPDEAAEEAEEDQGEEPEPEDDGGEYVRTLEDMLRLYRRRTEADVDAVCDRLLPGLLAEEE